MKEPDLNREPERKCPQCGAALPATAPAELCPKCLLKAGMASAEITETAMATPEKARASRGLPGPGEQLGHYEIIRLIGEGGMGAVFEAQDLQTGRRVALKVLRQALDSPEARQRFFREGRLAASLNHPNSVYVFGTEEIGGTPVIAMELVPGGTLQERVRKLGPLPPAEAVDAVLQIIAGLEAAQRVGILHRDIKPSNCFLGEEGTVKIGDFGLSISTSIRLEPALTVTGAFLGTPAFCSPEQLRGEELSVRSDMYSVGATLFFLLTGRSPFEGKTVVQLLATVLEKKAPSPRQFRPEIPKGLAKIVLRCLEKEPGERFRTYTELTRALAPYGSTAPTPATLGLRFAAGMVDMIFVGIAGTLLATLFSMNPFDLLNAAASGKTKALAMLASGSLLSVIYYGIFEGLYGAALGKRLLGLRVVRPGQAPPGILRAAFRAVVYGVLPAIPSWFLYSSGLVSIPDLSFAVQQAIGVSFYVVLASLFVTMRRHNGFAAIHDLLTGTRVVSNVSLQVRPSLPSVETEPVSVSGPPTLGPFHILANEGQTADSEWLLGFDVCLLRKVWIRKVREGTPPIPVYMRNLSRPGRLRWLAGRRSPVENWDAFEALTGEPFLTLTRHAQPWSRIRFWLHDLAAEIQASEKDESRPTALALDRVWITQDGRAKLLDFPSPGLERQITSASPPQNESLPSRAQPPVANGKQVTLFLESVVAQSLRGQRASGEPPLLPFHAQGFLARLPALPGAEAVLNFLKPLLHRTSTVSRLRRAAVVAGCAAFPLFAGLGTIIGSSFLNKWNASGLVELNTVLEMRRTANFSRFTNKPRPTDDQFAIYIAAHYRSVITNDMIWKGPFALSMIKKEARRFAETAIVEYPNPTPEQAADAEAAMEPYRIKAVEVVTFGKNPWMPLLIIFGSLIFYVAAPALLAALLFKGGLVLRVAGIAFVGKNGAPASRLRMFWRALVTWGAIAVVLPLGTALAAPSGATLERVQVWLIGGGLVLLLVLLSLAMPRRGLPDRLSGTWPVMR